MACEYKTTQANSQSHQVQEVMPPIGQVKASGKEGTVFLHLPYLLVVSSRYCSPSPSSVERPISRNDLSGEQSKTMDQRQGAASVVNGRRSLHEYALFAVCSLMKEGI